MTEVERLLAIEEIKQLKAKYFLYVDTHNWEGMRKEIFSEDISFSLPEDRPEPYEGIGTVMKMIETGLDGTYSVHHGHTPIINVTSNTTATGLWAMEDLIYRIADGQREDPGPMIHGWGHYHESYAKLDEGWRILSTRLTRLRTKYNNIA